MILHPDGRNEDRIFFELPSLLQPGDLLVRNNTKVLPARLLGKRPRGGGAELLLVRPVDDYAWQCLARPASHLKTGTILTFGEGELTGRVEEKGAGGEVTVRFSERENTFRQMLERIGLLPLPPYIKRPRKMPTAEDGERYQTAYAKNEGAVAAPTAGLHFTPDVDRELGRRGVEIAEVTLHIGPGTFRPIKVENISRHRMDAERYEISPVVWKKVAAAKREGRRLVAVGTSTVRALESAALAGTALNPQLKGWASLFIRPGHRFVLVDKLITNFHLPESPLLVMLAALAGRERILAAYVRAVREGYRFYSYGDAMLVRRGSC